MCVAQKTPSETPAHLVRHLERFPLGTAYPTIVRRVRQLMQAPPLVDRAQLVVDATGVGKPVVDLLTEAGLEPISVTITGGDSTTHEGRQYRVPKRELVTTVQVLLQPDRLKIAKGLPEAMTLMKEMLAFKVKITVSGHDTYEAWRERDHDDLVLAVCMATWYGEHGQIPFNFWFEPEPGDHEVAPEAGGPEDDWRQPAWTVASVLGRNRFW